ncbi:short-chain dehydrogenase/reductase SDR [Nostoc sp. NIES-3756]|uniref:oxidoreductase n=1 Tax=Nostoc sp. NIES-3756 TaxID=1751286 RepID=UPI00071F7311|nr:oxidoreductase [Nostoc sp. NIES-3756]BAT53839.1 short-chain dehydrogenase/reductase SDR [Nostoc sp. NIES-3756]BAY38424.1 short-chain dehydrogenase/reductase SDR [Nostoc sp. NIES-2111]
MSKVYLITGTSTGFGRALAEAVLEKGDKVVLTARKPEQVAQLAQANPENAIAIRLDVTNAEEREAAVQAAIERFGRIDVLVNNAGQGSLGAIEGFSSEQIRKQFEVNCFGVIEMTRAVLPLMRRQKSGHIINITSIGGLAAIGGFALYCSTKFAIEGFAEGLRDEVKPLGINVTIVEPGAFRTNFAGDANMQPQTEIDDYKPVVDPIRAYLYGNDGKQPGDPKKAALAIIQAVESENPPLRLMLGADAYGLWEQKRTAERQEFEDWKEVGINTAYENAVAAPIGG